MEEFGVARCKYMTSKKPLISELAVFPRFPLAIEEYRKRMDGNISSPPKDQYLLFIDDGKITQIERLVWEKHNLSLPLKEGEIYE